MKISLYTVGKLKEKYLIQGINEYKKRLGRYAQIEIIEVPDEKAPEQLSHAEMQQVKNKEGERLLQKIPDSVYLFALAIEGKQMDSIQFAKELDQLPTYGHSHIGFVIGGSLGLSQDVMHRANATLSIGPMTFPHQLMRLMLIEQIYRCFRINHNEPYHK